MGKPTGDLVERQRNYQQIRIKICSPMGKPTGHLMSFSDIMSETGLSFARLWASQRAYYGEECISSNTSRIHRILASTANINPTSDADS